MASAIPKVIRNYNLIIDGFGFAGIVDMVSLPTLQIKRDEHRAGGLDVSTQIDLGMEKIEIKAQLAEHSPVVFRQFGLYDGQAVSCVFRGAKADDKTVEPYVVTCRGSYYEINPGEIKQGERTTLSFTIHCRYFKLEMNGVSLIEIDVDNMKRIINGVDQLAAIRDAILV